MRRLFSSVTEGFRPGFVSASNFGVGSAIPHPVFQSSRSVSLDAGVFARSPIRGDLIQRVVVWQLAKRRQGTAKAKGRSEVSGSTKKAAPQKGRGKARVGSRRAPQFRHGGRAFPKTPRSFDFPLPHEIRRLGLMHALSAKYLAGKLVVVSSNMGEEVLQEGKTRVLASLVQEQGWKSALIVVSSTKQASGALVERAAFNLPQVDVLEERGLNVYDIVRRDFLLLAEDVLPTLQTRLLQH